MQLNFLSSFLLQVHTIPQRAWLCALFAGRGVVTKQATRLAFDLRYGGDAGTLQQVRGRGASGIVL